MTQPEAQKVTAAIQALETVRADWMARPGVVSVEVARRWQDGAPTDEVGIRVTVQKLRAPEDLPEAERFPSALEGVAVDVLEGTPPRPE